MADGCQHASGFCCRRCCAICRVQHELGAVRDMDDTQVDMKALIGRDVEIVRG